MHNFSDICLREIAQKVQLQLINGAYNGSEHINIKLNHLNISLTSYNIDPSRNIHQIHNLH